MIVYAYVHRDNHIHLHTFGAFKLPDIVSLFSHMFWLGPEVSDASLLLSKWASAFLPFAALRRKGGNASPDMRAHVAYGFAARAKCDGHADCSLVGKLHFSLKLLPGEQFTDGSLLRRRLSVAVCLYFLHTPLLDTVNVHWPPHTLSFRSASDEHLSRSDTRNLMCTNPNLVTTSLSHLLRVSCFKKQSSSLGRWK